MVSGARSSSLTGVLWEAQTATKERHGGSPGKVLQWFAASRNTMVVDPDGGCYSAAHSSVVRALHRHSGW